MNKWPTPVGGLPKLNTWRRHELFARLGDPSSFGEIAKFMAEVVSKVLGEQVMGDLDGAVKWAGKTVVI